MYRRKFIKTASAGAFITAISGKLAGCTSSSMAKGSAKEFGIQLYTLRDILPKDPVAVFKQLSALGYTMIESYDHDELGMFWGMRNTEIKKVMDDLGLRLVASHCKLNMDFEKKADAAAAIGMKYLVAPSVDNERNMDAKEAVRIAEDFNERGRICKARGMRMAYHNHENTLIERGGIIPEKIFIENTDPGLMDFEMDIYWTVFSGQDPKAWIKKYPGRFRLFHVKDRQKNANPSTREAFTTLGDGSIDLAGIIKVAREDGAHYFFTEQDQTYAVPVMEATKKNADYMKKV